MCLASMIHRPGLGTYPIRRFTFKISAFADKLKLLGNRMFFE